MRLFVDKLLKLHMYSAYETNAIKYTLYATPTQSLVQYLTVAATFRQISSVPLMASLH